MNRPSANSHPQQAMQMPDDYTSSRRSSPEIAREASSSPSKSTNCSTSMPSHHTRTSTRTASHPRSILSTSNNNSSFRRRERARSATGDAVSFSTRAAVWIIPSVNDMSSAQIDELWTNDDDTAACQRDVVKIIKALRRIQEQHPVDAAANSGSTSAIDARHNICTRGLEHMRSTTHLEQMRINKDCHYDAIFDEQERQEAEDIYDFDEMSLVSQHVSTWARERALERARGDEEFVQTVREEMMANGEWEELMSTTTAATTATPTQDQDTYGLDSIEQEIANSLCRSDLQDKGNMSSPRSSPNHHHQRHRACEQLHLRRTSLRKSFSEKPHATFVAKQRRSLADADYHVVNSKSAPRRLSGGSSSIAAAAAAAAEAATAM